MKRKKVVAVQSVKLDSTFVRGDAVIDCYKAEVLIRGKYFIVDFYTESYDGKVVDYWCNKAHLELFGVMIAYYGRQLTTKQGRNEKHNEATAKIQEAIKGEI